MFDVLERYVRDDSSGVFQLEKRCKALARIIKSRRAPPWPCLPTPEGTPELPARVVADSLVECYFNTSETLLRVLHIPSFRRAYEAVWDPDHNPDPAFLVQLKLVMAMGATTYDAGFSLRPSAVRWLYEAQAWLSTPEFKHRLTLASLQANILLLIAREAAGVGEDLCWIAVGSTLRIAMYMGLHRDPASMGPVTTPLVAEMRRRLWNTVLEIALQSSINSGGPPLISLDEFDTEPPGNYDDDQLTGVQGDMPLPKPDGHFSQTTIAISLRSMFPQRLAIVKYLNNLSSRSSYAETLKLDADLREAFKNLTRTLQACKTPPTHDPARGQGPSDLELRSLDILLRRYYIALHSPFFAPALKEAEFAFSRRVVVESAIRLWRAAFPTPLACSPDDDAGDDRSDPLARLATSGTGQFRGVVIQGFIAIAAELNALLKEEGLGLGPGPAEVRPDLLMALRDYKVWSWRAIESGETNTKGYMMACLVYAQVEAARRGLGQEEAAMVVIKEAEEAEERALVFLQETERRGRQPQGEGVVEAGSDGVGGSLVATPDLGVEDWDYMVSSGLWSVESGVVLTIDRCRMPCLTRLGRTSAGCFSESAIVPVPNLHSENFLPRRWAGGKSLLPPIESITMSPCQIKAKGWSFAGVLCLVALLDSLASRTRSWRCCHVYNGIEPDVADERLWPNGDAVKPIDFIRTAQKEKQGRIGSIALT